MARFLSAACITALLIGVGAAAPADAPRPFAPETAWPAGAWSSPAFTPDGKTVVVTAGGSAERRLWISHASKGVWSKPERAPFSDKWMDIEPAMSPDGKYLVFISNRPATPDGKPLDGFFGGQVRPGRGGNLWRVDRAGSGWGAPVRLPGSVNVNSAIYAPAVARNGDLYFMTADAKSGRMRLFSAKRRGAGYAAPQPLPFSDGVVSDYDPVVAPDQSFIVFSSARPPSQKDFGQGAIFIAHRDKHGGWSAPEPLGVFGSESRLSPDLKTLYFLSDRPTLESPKPKDGTVETIWAVLLPAK